MAANAKQGHDKDQETGTIENNGTLVQAAQRGLQTANKGETSVSHAGDHKRAISFGFWGRAGLLGLRFQA
eukprot:scaffold301982_cov18-Tisochrysis_lutea.AAC.1